MRFQSNYDLFPHIHVAADQKAYALTGWENTGRELRDAVRARNADKTVLCVDCYHGVWEKEILAKLTDLLRPDAVFCASEASISREKALNMLRYNITDDRVFGIMSHHRLADFFEPEKADALRKAIDHAQGLVLVFGVGAAYLCKPNILVYADMARWEIQLRFRSGRLANWLDTNYEEDTLRKYKRAFFIDWRVLDRHKRELFARMDYILDTNDEAKPKLMTGEAFRRGLDTAVTRPFRVKPYFDPGVWGGQWMKEKFGLPKEAKNYAWSFDCVPEENSLLLEVSGTVLEIPAIDLVFYHPRELLGDKTHARFGAEFPIRFDLLDTMQGGNLSLQVHPLTEYIQDRFGMHYTQDESYYLLDAGENTCVYLGCKNGTRREALQNALAESQRTGQFDADRFVNAVPAHKHDHFLIPGGTIHCSGKDCMVLEISATPYIFTFKLWDWGRLGLDGRPRPIHLEHGMHNIQFDRNTDWVMKNLVNRVETLSEDAHVTEERTGLHEREFIETRRHWFDGPVQHDTQGNLNVLNLVEGWEALVESPTGAFDPFPVHYAETFIVPAAVGAYTIRPLQYGESSKMATIKAFVRV
ncbi:MAG: class I mannose-6-phosphate isomerase [Clostridia bacterium]|nr:class I mannose-6-phosphate isomerase [Clostridia bacterium]